MASPELFRPRRALRRRESEIPGFLRPFEDMRRIMEDFWMRPFDEFVRCGGGFVPPVDVKEENNDVLIAAELPGIDRKDVDVTVTKDSVRISGEKKHDEKGYLRHESYCGSFERIIDLPTEVDEDKAEAEFSKGILTIKLPKSEEARAREKKVVVKSA